MNVPVGHLWFHHTELTSQRQQKRCPTYADIRIYAILIEGQLTAWAFSRSRKGGGAYDYVRVIDAHADFRHADHRHSFVS